MRAKGCFKSVQLYCFLAKRFLCQLVNIPPEEPRCCDGVENCEMVTSNHNTIRSGLLLAHHSHAFLSRCAGGGAGAGAGAGPQCDHCPRDGSGSFSELFGTKLNSLRGDWDNN